MTGAETLNTWSSLRYEYDTETRRNTMTGAETLNTDNDGSRGGPLTATSERSGLWER
jgi:hypothetical protein